MRVILIDDEYYALKYIEKQLIEVEEVYVLGAYSNPMEGKNAVLKEKLVDVVFLDIHLPEINGIKLARELLAVKPNLGIVFITAHDKYAVKAFELYAIDYLMKPVTIERVKKTIVKIQKRFKENNISFSSSPSLKINLFGNLSIYTEPKDYVSLRWRTSKTEEMFLYLLLHHDQTIAKDSLMNLLWPNYDMRKAHNQLYTTIYHVRKALEPLKEYIKVINVPEGYKLKIINTIIETDEWEKCMVKSTPISASTIQYWQSILNQYNGDYMEDYHYWWIENERFRPKQMWVNKAMHVAAWYKNNYCFIESIKCYKRIISINPYKEEAYFHLMNLYDEIDDQYAVTHYYNSLQKVLKEYNLTLSPTIKKWYNLWKKKKVEK